jgi:hypothetical protein
MIEDILSPNFAEDLLPRHDLVFIPQQVFQQLEFPEFQANLTAIPPDFMRVPIEYQASGRHLLTGITPRGK